MRGADLAGLIAALEHRELRHPEHVDALVVIESAGATQVVAECAERRVDDAWPVRDHEDAVPDFGVGRGADRLEFLRSEELRDAALPAVGALPEVREAARLCASRNLGELSLDIAAGEIVAALDADALDDAP